MPHTYLIEFEDFLVNTGSEINELPQHDEPQAVDRPHYEAVIRNVVSKFKASLKGKPRLWFEMQYPNVDDEPRTVQAYKNMLFLFTTEHNPIGSTREQQIMAWKTLKWDPTKEKLDDFVYKFRGVAKELGYNADENLDVFSCCVPSHLYLYLKGATTSKEAMENIKRACALGGVSVQANPAPVETKTTPAVPLMSMNDRLVLKTVSFKEEGTQDKVNDGLEKLSQILDKQLQLAEKQTMTVKVEVEEEKEEIVEIGDPDHMIDQAHMIDPVHMTGQRVEKDPIVEIEVEIEVVETKVEIKTQERRGTIQALNIPQVCFVIIAK